MRLSVLGQIVVTAVLLFIVWRVLTVKLGAYRLLRWVREDVGEIDVMFLVALAFIVLLIAANGSRSGPFDD